jgi:hypothetical protein
MHRRKSRHVDNDERDDGTVTWSIWQSYLLTSLTIEKGQTVCHEW